MRPRKPRSKIRLDLIPMVDIAFLMLIFYMSTTQFKPPEACAVELPASHSQIELPDRDVITLTITQDEAMYVDYLRSATAGGPTSDPGSLIRHVEPCSLASLGDCIVRARTHRQSSWQSLVVLKGDGRARYGLIKAVMDTLRLHAVPRFLIITEPEQDQENAS